jgi:hypothetical protein
MIAISGKIKPRHGFAHFFHIALNALLPAIVFVMVRINFAGLALAVILLSKWRMLAVKPRHWPANIRTNSVDIIVSLSFLIFMQHSQTVSWQLFWALSYGGWLIFLKPSSGTLSVAAQALLGQLLGLMALFLDMADRPLLVLVIAAWLITYASARHFLSSFDEPHVRLLAYLWAYFAAALTWVLGHWLLFYGLVAQPTLLLTIIGYALAGLYYLHETDRLSILVRRQLIMVTLALVFIVIVFSDWGDKTL